MKIFVHGGRREGNSLENKYVKFKKKKLVPVLFRLILKRGEGRKPVEAEVPCLQLSPPSPLPLTSSKAGHWLANEARCYLLQGLPPSYICALSPHLPLANSSVMLGEAFFMSVLTLGQQR